MEDVHIIIKWEKEIMEECSKIAHFYKKLSSMMYMPLSSVKISSDSLEEFLHPFFRIICIFSISPLPHKMISAHINQKCGFSEERHNLLWQWQEQSKVSRCWWHEKGRISVGWSSWRKESFSLYIRWKTGRSPIKNYGVFFFPQLESSFQELQYSLQIRKTFSSRAKTSSKVLGFFLGKSKFLY